MDHTGGFADFSSQESVDNLDVFSGSWACGKKICVACILESFWCCSGDVLSLRLVGFYHLFLVNNWHTQEFFFSSPEQTSGTTVTIVVVDGWTITVASVGDSRCVLDSQEVVSTLTVDHRLDSNVEEYMNMHHLSILYCCICLLPFYSYQKPFLTSWHCLNSNKWNCHFHIILRHMYILIWNWFYWPTYPVQVPRLPI